MAIQTPATAEIEKWLRLWVGFFTKFWLRVRIWVQKNTESCRSRLRHSGSMATSALHLQADTDMQWKYTIQIWMASVRPIFDPSPPLCGFSHILYEPLGQIN